MTDPQTERAFESVLRAYKPKPAPISERTRKTYVRKLKEKTCGHSKFDWHCRDCVREYNREWERKKARGQR